MGRDARARRGPGEREEDEQRQARRRGARGWCERAASSAASCPRRMADASKRKSPPSRAVKGRSKKKALPPGRGEGRGRGALRGGATGRGRASSPACGPPASPWPASPSSAPGHRLRRPCARRASPSAWRRPSASFRAACAAASRAMGSRYGRAGDVVEADLVAELDRARVAAVLAADAELEVGPRGAPLLDGDLHQRAHAVAVDGDERVDRRRCPARRSVREHRRHVVAGEAEGGLGQVVGAEGEELGRLGDLVRR